MSSPPSRASRPGIHDRPADPWSAPVARLGDSGRGARGNHGGLGVHRPAPPAWDHANHLERAFECYRILSEPGHDRFREIVAASSFYPPVVTCVTGLLYFVFPVAPLTAQAVMLGYLAVALAAVFALGSRLWDPEAGLLAALFLGTAPFVVFSLTNFQLDIPLMAMVALALYVLVALSSSRGPRGPWGSASSSASA